ncbi:LOW QUALITY PROTEIN: protein Niban-like [Rhinatrema bivittatum]|uniref:LOW QUALITY PROTEIN: protein Niban-like n=1 Tax=Rhinatrema bivittatum TaxID=194408 RepID=UPI00112D1E31|nr:LOW QUALITY PROTEIN: protein Niban-like [Rhinatrema bivittatum]
MGGSASSQLDEGKCSYIRGKTEALIKNFSPHYKRQYAVAFYNQIQNEVEQQRDSVSQFLKTKPPSDLAVVLYSAELAQFADDLKKWKDRYVVVKNEYAVESYESKEACQKGAEPKSKILPSGGKVVLSEEEYNVISDKNFPDPIASTEKENAQAFVVLPSVFPVYLWHPYTKHSFYCFQDEAAQKQFGAVLHDCIRHQNHEAGTWRFGKCCVEDGIDYSPTDKLGVKRLQVISPVRSVVRGRCPVDLLERLYRKWSEEKEVAAPGSSETTESYVTTREETMGDLTALGPMVTEPRDSNTGETAGSEESGTKREPGVKKADEKEEV